MKHPTFWRTVSGITGFTLALILNLTNWFVGLSVLAAGLQLVANGFVFYVWRKAYKEEQPTGFRKFVALCGVVVPVIMAFITLCFVIIIPLMLRWVR